MANESWGPEQQEISNGQSDAQWSMGYERAPENKRGMETYTSQSVGQSKHAGNTSFQC